MNEVLQYSAQFLQETGLTPSICLVLPFEPQLTDKHVITGRLRTMMAKTKGELLQKYSTFKALPAYTLVQGLIAGINYSNYKKSIALLASPYASKLFYLDFPVEETIRIGEYVGIREVIRAKKREVSYLVMVLGKHCARLYMGNPTRLTCIKSNQEAIDPASGYDRHFLHLMDQGLGLMLNAYALPVFILGNAQSLDQFRDLTVHEENIIGYLAGNFDTSTETDILMTLQPELHQWKKHRHQLLMQKLQKAYKDGNLSYGMKEVWNTATHCRGQLLVVEENFISPGRSESNQSAVYTFTRTTDDPYYMKDLVEDVMEKVLKDGGDVEFVEQGSLRDFQKIALIEFRQHKK
ncbi:hypothetical protein D3H65_08515 [Paraflavitalea soli]|uniref:Uncharacterized protein n=1 Tax=Paraflavitalea soli TaxID=2315862 RepID=A0A3B7ML59_9BACT|nr:hypothetical protein [Paraflavitalea soli]AXY74023.1 hypothetical protein D3H65_08515 [Paraflavitalea soli]